MQPLLRLSRAIDTFTQWVGIVAYWLIPIMVLIGVWNVFGRFLGYGLSTNLTSNALIELQWYIFSLTFFLGAPYALLHNEHVRVDVFYSRQSPRIKTIINLLGALLFLLPFCGLLIYFSWNFVDATFGDPWYDWDEWEQSPDPSGLPRAPIKALVIVGPVLLMVQGISEIIKNVARLRGDLPLPQEHDADLETETHAEELPADATHAEVHAPSPAATATNERPSDTGATSAPATENPPQEEK